MPNFSLERQYRPRSDSLVAGIDEVGRGPWAGPVTAAAVVWPAVGPDPAVACLIADSKQLSEKRRLAALEAIEGSALVGLGWASPREIDRHNILQATFIAMQRAYDEISKQMGRPIELALVDGNRLPALPCAARAVVKGDSVSLSIAAASIVAKVARDRHMAELAVDCPGYGWERNAGYGTAAHRAGLARLGPTPHHRASFKPIRALMDEVPAATS